ncbi:hypothetical protein DXD57_06595 [Bacteroides intestinalis]|nr:hypothetical protein DXD57_06595 [Bacteroides intestinalis]
MVRNKCIPSIVRIAISHHSNFNLSTPCIQGVNSLSTRSQLLADRKLTSCKAQNVSYHILQ